MPVTNVSESQQLQPDQSLRDVYDITFTITNAGGPFTVTVPQGDNALADAEAAIAAKAQQVGGIYSIGV